MEKNIEGNKEQYKDIGKSLEKVYDIHDYFSEEALVYLEEKINILKNLDNNKETDFEHYENFDEIIERYFEKIESDKENILDKFLECISCGDYNSAYNICRKKEYIIEADKRKKTLIFKIYEKLLTYLKYIMVINRLQSNKKQSTSKEVESLLIKDNYINAYEMAVNNSNLQESEDLALLGFMAAHESYEEKCLLGTIEKSFVTKDLRFIRRSIKKYETFLEEKQLKRDTSYFGNRLIALEKTLETGNYQNLEYLYKKALLEYKKRNYSVALKIIEEFINLYNNINPKGYILKGKIQESMKDFYKARKSYMDSLKIYIEPEACLRLGIMFFYTNKYEEALKYFLMYENFYPKKNVNNIKFLVMTYKKLKNDVKTVEYAKVLNRLRVK